ncbi:MAG: thioredoxin domain-containing protein, partial [Myxococcota bacterium]
VGVAIAGYLTQTHIAVKSGLTSGGVCNISATVNCDAAAASGYSELFGVPIAVLGLAGYVAAVVLVGWSFSRNNEGSDEPLSIASVLQSFFGLSVAYSVFLALISFMILPALCPACLALYAVNVFALVTTSLWTGRSPFTTLGRQIGALGQLLSNPASLTFVSVVALVVALGTGYTRSAIARDGQIAEAPKPRKVDASILYASHAPARGPADASLRLVVFSDFQCPYCGKFAKTLTFAEETFGPQLRTEFRHYPLPFHQFAPMASAIGICAHRQGRFWEWHDTLFANQSQVNPAGLQDLVRELGLDEAAIAACVKEEETQRILEQDHSAGQTAGVSGTPAFFVNGTFYNGALPLDELTRVLENELARVASAAAAAPQDTSKTDGAVAP